MDKIKMILTKITSKENRWLFLSAIILGLISGLILSGGSSETSPTVTKKGLTAKDHDHQKDQIWTCSMHPQIRQPNPGKCPLCGMDLIPASSGEGNIGERSLKLSPNAIKLAEIRTMPVEQKFVSKEVRLVGKVEYDETRLGYITSRVPGRIDRLFVNFTGTRVRKGDHLVRLYSPELVTAQQELIQSADALRNISGKVTGNIRESSERILSAVREKLRLWGLTPGQIKKIETSGKTQEHLTIYSSMSGIVINKNAVEGIYVNTGMRIYTIADLSFLWVKLDAYESDLQWLRYGQNVEFESEAYPGEIFKGKIAFIDPVLNSNTRTIKIRVNLKNPGNKLKPDMFVKAVIRSRLSESGKVIDPELSGKWISPMHPEIVKSHPGKCDVCGMPLVKAEDLGYLSSKDGNETAPLIIPSSAPLLTGTRAVVYVAVKGKTGVFEGREVVLGPKAGDFYIVKKGLNKGEMVVVNGAFKIDSDLQIQAKPSMMNPDGGGPVPGHDHMSENIDGKH
ncbi:MAG: efflux RND transporter periplasmic adaptor subunit [Acidobacteriota bacterium]